MLMTRRMVLGGAVISAAQIATGARAAGSITPAEVMGPFYPVVTQGESRADMSRLIGRTGRAAGTLVEIAGTVRTAAGKPVGGALVLVWQANAAGRYRHPRDSSSAALDPNFGGHALLRTASDGSFRLVSVKPGPYPDGPTRMRTPHLHFEVIGEDARLITQMYFPGEPLNDSDRLIERMAKAGLDPRLMIARATPPAIAPGARGFAWDIVLPRA